MTSQSAATASTAKIVTIVGARPQFVKAAVVSREIARLPGVEEVLVHTGQHYDERMSQVFFDELSIPKPAHNLQVGSATHGRQTAAMLSQLEELLEDESPDAMLVYGDTNSTLAGALAASKMGVPIAHVEAGLRSFNRAMPEEINRVLTDHAATMLLCPTPEAVRQLAREGIRDGVYLVGDVMYDASMVFGEHAERDSTTLQDLGVTSKEYILMTCHRAENTDDKERLSSILRAANRVSERFPIVFPVHPRTRGRLAGCAVQPAASVRLVEPVSYLEMLVLERNAKAILTDSGGVQKEAFFAGVPCVTTRDETEWVETVEAGANILASAETDTIVAGLSAQLERKEPLPDPAAIYGGGDAAHMTADLIAGMATATLPQREAA